MNKPKYLPVGSVSHGTLNPRDLIPVFEALLRSLKGGTKALLALSPSSPSSPYAYVDDLMLALDRFCPPFCYFGAHVGDGSDLGCWVFEEAIEDAIDQGHALSRRHITDIPRAYTGDVFLSHPVGGHVAHYRVIKGRAYQQWSICCFLFPPTDFC